MDEAAKIIADDVRLLANNYAKHYYANKTAALGFYLRMHERLSELVAYKRDEGFIVIAKDAEGNCTAVTRQDEEGRIISTLWRKE